MNRRKSREIGFIIIFEKLFNDIDLNEIIEMAKLVREVEVSDLSIRLANGVYSNLEKIDDMIEKHIVGWKKERISKVSLCALRLAIYEMLFENDIPNSVSINEAIELTKKYSTKEDASFINGILGSVEKSINPGGLEQNKEQ